MDTNGPNTSPLLELYPDDPPLMTFGGWDMPRDFGSIVREHTTVRESVGVFDLSHMGRLIVRGSGANRELQGLFSRQLVDRDPGRAAYGFFCDREGGCLDDAILYRRTPDEVWMVVNAANRETIVEWLERETREVDVTDVTFETVLLAVQGPTARQALDELGAGGLPETPFRSRWEDGGLLAATGYTGEDGGELWLDEGPGRELFRRIVEEDFTLCGLGARDTLRLEKGFPLHGHELSDTIDPVTAGLERFIDWDHDFVGRDVLLERKQTGPNQRVTGLLTEGRQSPRRGYAVRIAGEDPVGEVTSGRYSPTLERGMGMVLLDADVPEDASLEVEIRDRWLPAEQKEPPFV